MAKLTWVADVPDRWVGTSGPWRLETGTGEVAEVLFTGTVVLVDGTPCLQSYIWEADKPIHPRAFRYYDELETLDALVKKKILEVTPAPWNDGHPGDFTDRESDRELFEKHYSEFYDRVDRAATSPRRRRQITPELLAQVLALYESQGIEAVKKKWVISARYAWRLVARARKELGQ